MQLSMYDFSRAITDLNREEKYCDSLKYFKENKTQFTNEQIASNEYLVTSMFKALWKTGNYNSAFKFIKYYNIEINENSGVLLLTSYGWLLYVICNYENKLNNVTHSEKEYDGGALIDTPVNGKNVRSDIIEKISHFLTLANGVDESRLITIKSRLFSMAFKTEKDRPAPNWELINELCDAVSPKQLLTSCEIKMIKEKGVEKQKELASDKENWYAARSIALIKLGMYAKCYEISKEALTLLNKFHYNNDIWFERRMALSQSCLGNYSEAIVLYEKILKRKKEWYIQKELAEAYKGIGDYEKAFKYAIEAINNYGPLEFKIDLIKLLGDLLKLRNEAQLASMHYSLYYLIRKDKGWKISQELNSVFTQNNIPEARQEELGKLKTELNKYWKSFIPLHDSLNNMPILSGKIERLLHNDENGTDGFIKYEGNKSIYFRVKASESIAKNIKENKVVSFSKLPAVDGKKEKAIHLSIK